MTKFNFHYDAGHGWLKVSLYDALDVGLDLKDFSVFSYRRGNELFLELFLEEDCDAGVFVKAWKAAGRDISFVEIDDGYDSPIRNYTRLETELAPIDCIYF